MLIRAGKASDPTYLKHYLRSFPGHVQDAVEKYMKDKNLNYQNLSIAQLHHHIKETWQEHCLEKRIDKDFKRHQNMYTPSFCKKVAQMPDWGCGAHNRGHLNQKCQCSHKPKKKNFFTSDPRYHYPAKPLKFNRKRPKYQKYQKQQRLPPRKKKYITKRQKPADKESCFLCDAKGHWENKCPKKKAKPRLAAFCASVQPQWWRYSSSSQPPTGDYLFLP